MLNSIRWEHQPPSLCLDEWRRLENHTQCPSLVTNDLLLLAAVLKDLQGEQKANETIQRRKI